MKRRRTSRSIKFAALLSAAWLCQFGCGRDAYVLVTVNGGDARTSSTELQAKVIGLQAAEIYAGSPQEVSFFLPEGALGTKLEVAINAWGTFCLLATGRAEAQVENRPRLDLEVQLEPVPSCQ